MYWYDSLDSTNEEARRRIAAGQAQPAWLATSTQTAGRGRSGRAWRSPVGNLYTSLLCPLDGGPQLASRLPFAMAVAAGDAVQSFSLSPAVEFKWPNDLRAGRAKLGGILVETLEKQGVFWVICGIGINVAEAPDVSDQATTCLHALGAPAGLDTRTLLDGLHASTAEAIGLAMEDFDALLAAWMARAEGLNEAFRARPNGEEIEGQFIGLERSGALRLRLANGDVAVIHAGDVNLVEQG